jgi:polysaccharide pyruvyl transferase WcaK-like protein
MIIILTGAYKNVGDHLIGYRAKELLKEFVDTDILELDRKEDLNKHLEVINKAKALILCGGPAYNEKIYPNIYTMTKNLEDIKVPIIPFGLGLSKSDIVTDNFKFTEESKKFISLIHSHITSSSTRDNMTKNMLNSIGIDNVTMTGCPVWYELSKLNQSFKVKDTVEKVVFTTPAHPKRLIQTIKLMKLTKKKFPNSEIYCTFHRGMIHESLLKIHYSLSYILMATYAKILNFEVLDVSQKLSDIDFYKECDFHIGYRVHAHLFFLSNRIPSILINEDIRGKGMSETLPLPVFNFNDNSLLDKVEKFLDKNIKDKFSEYKKVQDFLDKNFEKMKSFLETIK